MSASLPGNKRVDNLIGKTLGQFEILDEIGRGGMAAVYRARQKSINRVVALKVLPPALLHDPTFYERFTREVDLSAQLEHPHIVPIYDYGETEGIPFIAMRYLAGGSVAGLIRRQMPTLAQIEKPLTQVAQALDHAHLQGVIHRDLKPGNILIDEHNNAYLTDFGIARVLNSNLTGSAIIGTPAYMSPEQANGLPLDARSDIYSLGIVLFEMITGREPFEAETPVALLLKHIGEPMPSPRTFRPDVPRLIEQVIMVATAKQPDERFASAGDVARAYSEALRVAPLQGDYGDHPTMMPDSDGQIASAYQTPRPMTPIRVTPPPQNLHPPRITPARGVSVDDPNPTYTPGREVQTNEDGVPAAQSEASHTPRSTSRAGLLVGGLLILGVILGGVLMLPRFFPALDVNTLPTPFGGAAVYTDTAYRLSVPADWRFTDQSEGERDVSIWQLNDQAFVTVSVLNRETNSRPTFTEDATQYDRTYYLPLNGLTFVDERNQSEDGWLRRSYRLQSETFPPGQMDVFYLRQDPYLVVIETFSADTAGNTFIPVFQNILDSLRVTTG